MLDTREYDQLIYQGQEKCTGASVRGLTAELYDVLKEFFIDSNSWTEKVMFSAEANVTTYELTPLDGGKIIRLVGVWGPNNIFLPAVMENFGTVVLINAPTSTPTTQWMAKVVKTVGVPVDKAGKPDAPEWVLSVYGKHILDGLLGNMMSQKGKAWTDSTQSTYHLRRFRAGIQMARTAATRANLVGGQEWMYPRDAIAGSQKSRSNAWPVM